MINASPTLQVLTHTVAWLRRRSEARERGPLARRVGGEAGLDPLIYAPPSTPAWEEAWALTEALLLTMRDEVTARGARFLIVTLSNGHQVHPDAELRAELTRALGVPDLYYADDRIAAFGERHGIPVLGLARPLQRIADSEGVFLHGFENTEPGTGHWNADGHRRAGELMAEEVRRLLDG